MNSSKVSLIMHGKSELKTVSQCIKDLTQIEKIKVWSLIVTLFGDCGAKEPAHLSGKEINRILGNIGINPPAIRVALHRLKKEGWINTAKSDEDGREVTYILSKRGLRETVTAYEDVYRESVKYSSGWTLQMYRDAQPPITHPYLPLFKNVFLTPVDQKAPMPGVMGIGLPNEIPDWFVEKVVPHKLEQLAQSYWRAADNAHAVLDECGELDRLSIRLLALHHWRKMALRDSTWFHIWLFEDGAFAKCQKSVLRVLQKTS